MYCKGKVIEVRQHSGCLEVVVEGELPGAFPIDNCCVWSIMDIEGTNWIGREVVYKNGMMRFTDCLDTPLQLPASNPPSSHPLTQPA